MDILTPARKWAIAEQESPLRGADETKDSFQRRLPFPQFMTMFLSVIIPIGALIAGIILCWNRGPAAVGWPQIISMIIMYSIAGYGTTIGYHRLLTHKAFETYRPIRLMFAIFGATGAQGAPIRWAATHRRHHQVSDREGDPHSPHIHGDRAIDILRGLWHAHLGWLFHKDPLNTADSVSEMISDPTMMRIDRLYLLWVFLSILVPGIGVGLWEGTWAGFWSGVVWGGLVRICLMQHVTWSINSICHVWGTRPFKTADQSVNNPICAIVALGEGWHNNHHAFPTSARQGLRWWEFDSSWIIIWLMGQAGLAWNIRTPAPSALEARKLTPPAAEAA